MGQANSFFCFSFKIIKTKLLKMCIFVNFFQTEISEEDAALREQGSFSPYTVALIVSKKIFLSRDLYEMTPSYFIIFDACLGNRCTKFKKNLIF